MSSPFSNCLLEHLPADIVRYVVQPYLTPADDGEPRRTYEEVVQHVESSTWYMVAIGCNWLHILFRLRRDRIRNAMWRWWSAHPEFRDACAVSTSNWKHEPFMECWRSLCFNASFSALRESWSRHSQLFESEGQKETREILWGRWNATLYEQKRIQ